MRPPRASVVVVVAAVPVFGQVVSYEATSYPEMDGWTRDERMFLADRWLDDGWFVQYAEMVDTSTDPVPEDDSYRRSLTDFRGAQRFFVEWRMMTDGPAEGIPDVAPAVLAAAGRLGIWYHFTIARDQLRFIWDISMPVVLRDIKAGIPHTHRLEVFGGEWYVWYVDGDTADSGIPEGPYPTSDSFIVFGARAAGEPSTARWDYIRWGDIPVDGSGDFDSDEDVDGRDFYFFHECLTNRRAGINGGPGNDAGPGCRFADFDGDADVDLDDIAAFQRTFTGGE